MHSEFLDELNRLRQRTARFRKVALHIHSPDSFDWGRGADPDLNSPERFNGNEGISEYNKELEKHLELAAVTDHMKCGLATRASSATAQTDRFMVLPGMEVNFRPEAALGLTRIHLLVILPHGATPEDFMKLFAGIPMPPDNERKGQEEVSGVLLREFVKRVHDERGLCIAAHVDSSKGVRRLFRQTAEEVMRTFSEEGEDAPEIGDSLKEYLFDAELDGIGIRGPSDRQHYRWLSNKDNRTRSIATVLTFDAHSVEEFGRHPRVTHCKMTTLGIEGLRNALRFADSRIRFPKEIPEPRIPKLLGMRLAGGEESFFDSATIAFSENLTCLIGPRGSGKSTLIEALRYVFGGNRDLAKLGRLESSIRELQTANLAGCKILVAYQTAKDETFVLETTFDSQSDYSTKVFTPDGEYVEIADVTASGDFPLHLFGWSEIEKLGQDPSLQRDLLDRLVPGIGDALARRKGLRTQLLVNRGEVDRAIENLARAFSIEDEEIRRYAQRTADFTKLNTTGVQHLFQKLDLAHNKRELLEKVKGNAEDLIASLGDPDDLTLESDVDAILQRCGQGLRDWWLEVEINLLSLHDAEQEAQLGLRRIQSRLKKLIELIVEHLKTTKKDLENIHDDLRRSFAGDASMQAIIDLRSNAEKRLRRTARIREDYRKAYSELVSELKKREEITDGLDSVQNEISGIRAKNSESVVAKLNRGLQDEMRIEIHTDSGGDVREFEAAIRELLGRSGVPRYQVRSINKVIARNSTPVSLAKILRSADPNSAVGWRADIDGTEQVVSAEDAARIADHTHPFELDEFADVSVLSEGGARLKAILDLQEVQWDDNTTILLDGRPVNEKSPGQRSSAMLPLIALSEKTPLVIDQPEDNLDKRLIGNVLVRVLANLKEQRQMIVCTHDPNFLVGGDAEQVVVLEAESSEKGTVDLHGSIDCDDIVQRVIDLLEGGQEAFDSRSRKYNLDAQGDGIATEGGGP